MRQSCKIFFYILYPVLAVSCSLKTIAYKAAANAAAPLPSVKARQKIDPSIPSPITVFTGEEDIELVASVFPSVLKVYEAMYVQNPKHQGLALMSGELYIMYANAFVETPAIYLSDHQYDKKNEQLLRAKKLYIRGTSYIMNSMELAYPGFKQAAAQENIKDFQKFLNRLKHYDTEALYWASAGLLASFALAPLDAENAGNIIAAIAMLERAKELNSEYNNGAIWELLTKVYASAPEAMGGNTEKAEEAYKKAIELCGEINPSIHVTYAVSFCIPKQDSKGFDKAIEKALEIDPEKHPDNKLLIKLSQDHARWLKKHKSEFILKF